jgi:hypothetical protein
MLDEHVVSVSMLRPTVSKTSLRTFCNSIFIRASYEDATLIGQPTLKMLGAQCAVKVLARANPDSLLGDFLPRNFLDQSFRPKDQLLRPK